MKMQIINKYTLLLLFLLGQFSLLAKVEHLDTIPRVSTVDKIFPNQINGFITPDPIAGINLMSPPTANAYGTAALNYPLDLPEGRNGMTPEISINYNHENTGGWLGQGWDLSLSTITIDTRWGVPMFKSNEESETYLYDGSALSPQAHRDTAVVRTPEKQFFERVELDFKKIIRHGDTPSNYWWEVSDKSGLVSYYGGTPETDYSPDFSLTNPAGNIVQWNLAAQYDPRGNHIKYEYEKISDPLVSGSPVPGSNIYPKRIFYAGKEDQLGNFKVEFIRDRNLSESRKKDATMDLSLGFKLVDADLLRKVEVTFQDKQVRSYELRYEEGVFYKTVLKKLVEFDREGLEFYSHAFDYFNETPEVNDGWDVYGPDENWSIPNDNLDGGILIGIPGVSDKTPLLGGTVSASKGGGASMTIGFNGSFTDLSNTIGGNLGFDTNEGHGVVTLVDINGDNLPDKLFQEDDVLYYRANQHTDIPNTFGPKRPVIGLKDFVKFSGSSFSGGVEGHLGVAFAGWENTTDKTKVGTYLMDFNADGLVDIAHNKIVYFNHLNADGDPTFTKSSAETPNPIIKGSGIDFGSGGIDIDEQEALIDQFPLHDVVKVWTAPFDGTVDVTAPVSLVEFPDAATYLKNDGVRVTIQLRGTQLWATNIGREDFTVKNPTGVGNLQVDRGDRIYFRLQSRENGLYDEVEWDPIIAYRNQDLTTLDLNGKELYRYQYSKDYLTAYSQSITMPFDGQVEIKSFLNKPILSDTIVLQIEEKKSGNLIYSEQYPFNQIFSDSLNISNVSVNEGDEITVRVYAKTTVDWQAVEWVPIVTYTQSPDVEVYDDQGNPTFVYCPAVDFFMHNETLRTPELAIAPESGTYEVSGDINVTGFFPVAGFVTLSIKGNNKIYASQQKIVVAPFNETFDFEVDLEENDSIYIEYHSSQPDLTGTILNVDVDLEGPNESINVEAGLHSGIFMRDSVMGSLHRRWGQFVYNGNRNRANMPIDESELNIDFSNLVDDSLLDQDSLTNDQIQDLESPTGAPFIVMYADPKTKCWRGLDDFTFVKATRQSSSRLGEDDIILSADTPGDASCFPAPILESKTVANALSLGFNVGIGGSISGALGTTTNLRDIGDFNGDSYPDIATPDHIQYTNQLGGLEEDKVHHGKGTHLVYSYAYGLSAGGSLTKTSPNACGDAAGAGSNQKNKRKKSKVTISGARATDSEESTKHAIGLSGSYGNDWDTTSVTYLDINADGLDDILNSGGQVYLNNGRDFIGPEDWGFEQIRAGFTTEAGGGLGINLFNGSIVAGGSGSWSETDVDKGFQDFNGDGLLDYFIREDDKISVQLNTGSSLDSAKVWRGITRFDHGNATGESINTAFTVCINFPFFRICLNPDFATSRGVSQQIDQLTDIDGDGFADHVTSSADNELIVKRSLIGKSNLLKTVTNPLGATYALDYSNSPNSYEVPLSKYVLSNLVINDRTPGDGADVAMYNYEYSGGKFDRRERIFYGYKNVKMHHMNPAVNDEIYRTFALEFGGNNFYDKGLITAETITDGDQNIYLNKKYYYKFLDPETGDEISTQFLLADTERAFPALINKTTNFHEGDVVPELEANIEFEYDLVGNVIKIVDSPDDQPANVVETNYTYANLNANNILNVIDKVEITNVGALQRKTEFDVDAYGNPTQIRRYLTNSMAAITDMEYDDYGNIVKITRPENEAGERLSYTIEFDSLFNKYIAKITDSYGYVTSFETDPMSGIRTKIVGINGHETNYTVDKYNRLASITGPYELDNGQDYTILLEYHPLAAHPHAVAKHYDSETEMDIEIYSIADKLGRTVQTKKTSNVYKNGTNQLSMVVSGLNKFDAYGRIIEKYQASEEGVGSNGNYNIAPDGISPTIFSYDILDRLLSTTKPSGSLTQYKYDVSQDVAGNKTLRTSVINPLGNVFEQHFDSADELIAIKYNGPEGEQWIQYQLNAMAELVAEIDALGNVTRSEYDLLGRKIAIEYPDAGRTELNYDLNGNLTQRITSNIREILPDDIDGAIRYKYEFERLVGIDYPKNFQNKVQLHYGDADAEFNRKGRVWLQEDGSGGQEFYYGINGEIEKTIRTVLISESNVQTFVHTAKYDGWNRIQELIYPDGEIVDFEYAPGGRLNRMTGKKTERDYLYIDGLGFDKFGDRVWMKNGNDTELNFQFDEERRKVDRLIVNSPFGKVVDYSIGYDPNGNLISSQNSASVLSGQLGGSNKEELTYDQLDRLIQGSGEWSGSGTTESYQLIQEHNLIDKLTFKSQTHLRNGKEVALNTFTREYIYNNPEKPHNPSQIGALDLAYDPNGNMAIWNSTTSYSYQQNLWDEESRLLGTSLNGKIAQFTYDANGERALKSHGDFTGTFVNGAPAGLINHFENYTAYVNPYFTVEENEFHKHYFIDGQRFLSKRGVGQFDFNLISDQSLAAGKINYAQRAQLLRNEIKQYYEDLGIPPGPPTLPGLYGQPELNANSLPNAEPDNAYGVPPISWPSIIQPDSLGPPGVPVFYPSAPTHDEIQPGYGFLGNPVVPEIDCSFYHYDPFGNTNYITDFNGKVRQHNTYFPSGEIWIAQDTLVAIQPYLYAGKEFDFESGLSYFGARYFDAKLGIWQSADPSLQDYGLKTLDTRTTGKQFFTYGGPNEGASGAGGVSADGVANADTAPSMAVIVGTSDNKDKQKLKLLTARLSESKPLDLSLNGQRAILADEDFETNAEVKKQYRKYQIRTDDPETQQVAAAGLQDAKKEFRKVELSPRNDDDSRMLRRKLRGEFRRNKIGLRNGKSKPKISGVKTRLRG